MSISFISAMALAAAFAAPAQDHHGPGVDRANKGMGFEQAKTIHHFRIAKDGGAIEVTAKDREDRRTVSLVRGHLQRIEQAFADGDFSVPLFIHETEPPGTAVMKEVMKERRSSMIFAFELMPAGARIVVKTSDPQALAALHDFLRFQIREHKTGDRLNPK